MACLLCRQREVTVTRNEERGYGFTVSGESPVMVQEVKEGECVSIILACKLITLIVNHFYVKSVCQMHINLTVD